MAHTRNMMHGTAPRIPDALPLPLALTGLYLAIDIKLAVFAKWVQARSFAKAAKFEPVPHFAQSISTSLLRERPPVFTRTLDFGTP